MKKNQFKVTLALTLVMWLAFGAAGGDPRRAFGYNLPADPALWHLLSCGFTAAHLTTLGYLSVAAIAFAAPAERVMGSRRFALAAIASQAVTMPLACVIGAAVERAGFNLWGPNLVNEVYCTPVAWIFGPLAFASAGFNLLWRRRVRLVCIALTATLVLYAGSLASVAALTAVAVGWVASEFATGFNRPPRAISLRESRVLVATVVMAVAAGPAVTALNPAAQGPFATTSELMWEPTVAARDVARACADPTSTACLEAQAINQQNGLGPFVLNCVPFILAVLLAFGLVRGRRLAWIGALTLSLVSAAVVGGQALSEARRLDVGVFGVWNTVLVVLPFALVAVALISTRTRFRVSSAWRPAVAPVAAAFGASAVAWLAGSLMLRGGFLSTPTLSSAVAELPSRYLPPVLAAQLPHHLFPHSAPSWVLYEWVGIVFWAIAFWQLWKVLTSAPSPAAERDREWARSLLMAGTGDHLAWMTLWEGNAYFFIDDSYVAYRVANGIAVTVGGPVVGETRTREGVAEAFETFVAQQGWRVAWYSVDGEFTRDGYKRIHVAEESLLRTDNVEFKGKKFQNIRTARNRAAKEGVRAVWTTWDECDVETREKIAALSEQWVADKALPEMGFTLGTLEELKQEDTKLLLALDDNGRLHGVTSWLPVYENGALAGYTLDFMRRDAKGFRPVIEFLLAEAAVIAGREGLGWVSLSGAPLARTDAPTDFVEILLDKAGATIEPLYGFRSLAASKHKFNPEHRSWYLAYNDEMALANIGLAVVHCYLPEMKATDAAAVVKEFLARRPHAAPYHAEVAPAQPASGTIDCL